MKKVIVFGWMDGCLYVISSLILHFLLVLLCESFILKPVADVEISL